MNPATLADAKKLVKQEREIPIPPNTQVGIGVSDGYIGIIGEMLENKNLKLAAQNIHSADKGAFTGAMSAQQLKSIAPKLTHVFIGHSERRHGQAAKETDQEINVKMLAAIKNGLVPILCVGETLPEREAKLQYEVIRRQLFEGLRGVGGPFIIAYEPVWAIGTNKVATDEEAERAIFFIRRCLNRLFGKQAALNIPILYGGSMKPENVKGLLSQPNIDGGLVGGASLKSDEFAAIVAAAGGRAQRQVHVKQISMPIIKEIKEKKEAEEQKV
jgi:triosephosphate isomerase